MSLSQSQVSRLAESHYQVRITRGYSVIDVRINDDHEAAQCAARYLAAGLDALLEGASQAVGNNSKG